ncbi:unnamed protein product, partial [Sphacelaria rigidula]
MVVEKAEGSSSIVVAVNAVPGLMYSPETTSAVKAELGLSLEIFWSRSTSMLMKCNVPFSSVLIGILNRPRSTWELSEKTVDTPLVSASTGENKCFPSPGTIMA